MSHNNNQLEFYNDNYMHEDIEDHQHYMQKELDGIVGTSNKNKNSRNNNIRGSHSEKPNKNMMNGIGINQPLYSIPKHPNYVPDDLQYGKLHFLIYGY